MSTSTSLGVEDLGSAAQRERRKRMLDATIALAAEGGFDAVQMRAVAERADVALGTLYRYFPSKIHLLVSCMAREFDSSTRRLIDAPIPGDDAAERVIYVLRNSGRGLQVNRKVADALTRAFMFADASVKSEIHVVGELLSAIVTAAMDPDRAGEPTERDRAVARIIGDVWLSALVAWVTGRMNGRETAAYMDEAVRIVLGSSSPN
ncbi:MAG: TetR family transcriptional regulator [Nocardioides sp.]|uniref:TetR family transcriptional regulator n=1 Tax=Nocardioides sp. TaxID=35761 RepID=UPI003F0D880A